MSKYVFKHKYVLCICRVGRPAAWQPGEEANHWSGIEEDARASSILRSNAASVECNSPGIPPYFHFPGRNNQAGLRCNEGH